MSVNFWFSSACGHRPTMEDEHVTEQCDLTGWLLFAVCDGHGGTAVVKHTKQTLSSKIFAVLRQMDASPPKFQKLIDPKDLKESLKNAIVELDREMENKMDSHKERNSGCTLNMALYHGTTRQIVLINLGDSRSVYQSFANFEDDEKQNIIVSTDHKPDDDEERKRIVQAGAYVKDHRVSGILALSRALGDFSLKHTKTALYDPIKGAVNAVPKILVGLVPKVGALLILACDGIFDVLSSQDTLKQVQSVFGKPNNPAYHLVSTAFQKGSTDNMTAIVIHIK
jgi:protein phosphatase 2C family protein 2/3